MRNTNRPSKSETRPVPVYTFNEISQLYFPKLTKKSASKRLKVWIMRNKHLLEDLLESGYMHGARYLTPRQSSLIFDYLGEPDSED